MTIELFRTDSYLKDCRATVIKVLDQSVVLDQTVFYPTGGGQPADHGVLILEDGATLNVVDCFKDRETGEHLHILEEGQTPPGVGTSLTCQIDWTRRYRFMRMHTLLHVLCGHVDGAVSGGSIGLEKSRLDFDLPQSPDKDALSAAINRDILEDLPVMIGEISDQDLNENPDLVRTMSVKPPMGQGHVRTIQIKGVDYQPCGGTHVRSLGEIGPIRIGKIEKKGKLNRRINVHFAE